MRWLGSIGNGNSSDSKQIPVLSLARFPLRRGHVCVACTTRGTVENSRVAVHHLSTPDFGPVKGAGSPVSNP